jgi:rod shape-determining protein MreC
VPVYSVNRRRAILLLILSSVLLLTLDLRGNPIIDRARSIMATALSPFETAGDVVATPIRNAWHGATDYQDLERENERLRDQIAQQRGDQLAARAVVSDYQELLTLNGLTANYPAITARVVGGAPGNFEQTVEIDRGAQDQLLVGMTVVNFAGLVGKITAVYQDRSVVRLVTDADYAIECKVLGVDSSAAETDESSTTTAATTPSGENVEDLGTTTTTSPPTTTTIASADTGGTDPDDTTGPTSTTTTDESSTTTTTAPAVVQRETGGCEGRGEGKLPAMRFITENPVFGTIDEGAIITTAGGSKSLAPPDIIIGTVVNKIERASSAGPLLEIQLSANLDHLSLVQIIQFRPTSEVPG